MIKKLFSALSGHVNKSTLRLGAAFMLGLMLPIFILLAWTLALSLQKPADHVAVDEQYQENMAEEPANGVVKTDKPETVEIPSHRYSTDNPPEVLRALYGSEDLADYEMSPLMIRDATFNTVSKATNLTKEFYSLLISSPSCEAFTNRYIISSGSLLKAYDADAGPAYNIYNSPADAENCFTVTNGQDVFIAGINLNQPDTEVVHIGESILWIDEHRNVYRVYRRPFSEYETNLQNDLGQSYPGAEFINDEWKFYASEYKELLQDFYDNSGEVELALENLKVELVDLLGVETGNPRFEIRSNGITEIESYYFVGSDGTAQYLGDSQTIYADDANLTMLIGGSYESYISPNEEWAVFIVGLGEVSRMWFINIDDPRLAYTPKYQLAEDWRTIPGADWKGIEWLDDGRFYIGSAQCMFGTLGDEDFSVGHCGSYVSIASGAPWKMKKLESPLE